MHWLFFVIGAGLCWGTYVPLIQTGQQGLKGETGPPAAFSAFLCVGIAYFILAVMVPVGALWGGYEKPVWRLEGIGIATLAGAAGALGALCVIFAIKSGGDKRFVAPVIFALAPIINTVVSLFWHPTRDNLWVFGGKEHPDWIFYVGIVLAGLGAGMVLLSKEIAEQKAAKARGKPAVVAASRSEPLEP